MVTCTSKLPAFESTFVIVRVPWGVSSTVPGALVSASETAFASERILLSIVFSASLEASSLAVSSLF